MQTRRTALAALGSLALAPALARGQTAPSPEISLSPGVRVATLPFQLVDNRIFVTGRVNGAGPYQIVFDTGGANLLTPETARAAGLSLSSSFSLGGAGEGQQQAWTTSVGAVEAGDVRMRDASFTVISFADMARAIGFTIDGMFGFEVLQRFVVHIDYERGEITFAEPDAAPTEFFQGAELPITFANTYALIKARAAAFDVMALIDTGDRSSLTFLAPFAADNGLHARPHINAVSGWGVGGAVSSEMSRTRELSVGPFKVNDVTTRVPLVRSGVFATRVSDASIGTGVWKRFHITFDYGRERIFLRPNANFSAPDPMDRSGMWMSQPAQGDWINVMQVGADTAAEAAGCAPATASSRLMERASRQEI